MIDILNLTRREKTAVKVVGSAIRKTGEPENKERDRRVAIVANSEEYKSAIAKLRVAEKTVIYDSETV